MPEAPGTTIGADIPAKLTAFGFPPSSGTARIAYRTRGWRASRTLLTAAITLGLAPVALLVPPHVPWALLVVGGGAWTAYRRWTERYTLLEFRAPCPKCGAALAVERPTRLKSPFVLPCTGCHHELGLEPDDARMPRG